MILPTAGVAVAAGTAVVGDYSRVTASPYVNMRTGASTRYPIVTRLYTGQIVKVVAGPYAEIASTTVPAPNWYRVSYRDKVGYVSAKWMTYTGLAGKSRAASYPRLIVVSLARQQVEAYEGGKLVLISAVVTGRPELPTPAGTTKVYAKYSPHTFHSPWPVGSPYWYATWTADFAILFRSGGYYFHEVYYRPEGGYGYGRNVPHIDSDGVERTGSRGCVNTPYWAVEWLYKWAIVGTPVIVLNS